MSRLNLAPYAHLAQMDEQQLYQMAQHMRDLQGHPGWAFVQQILASMQQAEIEHMIVKVHDQATYAEKSGVIKGLKRAFDAPQAVVAIAEREQAKNQKAAEAAERNNS